MNQQEIFNKVYAYALTKEKPSMAIIFSDITEHDEPTCVYRSENGPCLIGHLISDEAYSSDLESKSAGTVEVLEALVESGIFEDMNEAFEFEDFLCFLQNCHDDAYDYEQSFHTEMMKNLHQFAVDNKLTIPVVTDDQGI